MRNLNLMDLKYQRGDNKLLEKEAISSNNTEGDYFYGFFCSICKKRKKYKIHKLGYGLKYSFNDRQRVVDHLYKMNIRPEYIVEVCVLVEKRESRLTIFDMSTFDYNSYYTKQFEDIFKEFDE